jgi:hypothetical protein
MLTVISTTSMILAAEYSERTAVQVARCSESSLGNRESAPCQCQWAWHLPRGPPGRGVRLLLAGGGAWARIEIEQRLWASASWVITTRASFWVCRCR